jgi:hypothetical protein
MIKNILEKMVTPEESFDDRYKLYNLNVEEKQVEEVKMLSDKIVEPLLNLDKFGWYLRREVILTKDNLAKWN